MKTLFIGFIVVLILVGVAGYFLLTQKQEAPPTLIISEPEVVPKTNFYSNEKLGYTFAIPDRYRLASNYMKFMNNISLQNQ
jgi:flagellar basal body-associated protein FliL